MYDRYWIQIRFKNFIHVWLELGAYKSELGHIYSSPKIKTHEGVISPSLAFLSGNILLEDKLELLERVPNLIIEIVPVGSEESKIKKLVDSFLEIGVKSVWIVKRKEILINEDYSYFYESQYPEALLHSIEVYRQKKQMIIYTKFLDAVKEENELHGIFNKCWSPFRFYSEAICGDGTISSTYGVQGRCSHHCGVSEIIYPGFSKELPNIPKIKLDF